MQPRRRPQISRWSLRQRPTFSDFAVVHTCQNVGRVPSPPPPPTPEGARVSQNGCMFIVQLACMYLRSVCDYFCPRSNPTVVARRPHVGRTLTCHHLPLLCDYTDRWQVFEHVQKPKFECTFTCGYSIVIAQMPYVWRTFTCVHWR